MRLPYRYVSRRINRIATPAKPWEARGARVFSQYGSRERVGSLDPLSRSYRIVDILGNTAIRSQPPGLRIYLVCLCFPPGAPTVPGPGTLPPPGGANPWPTVMRTAGPVRQIKCLGSLATENCNQMPCFQGVSAVACPGGSRSTTPSCRVS